ncbi:hypothetical protein BGZ94_005969 [Podila epigama]|nr:hypothetical protein BGZ94_005969 [Podila epigama]
MEAVALSLGLKSSFFRDLFGPTPYYRLKAAKYPSVNKPSTIGCGAHKDTGFLTVLLQDMVGGLQGQDPKTGLWMDTCPVPETFIVTMGHAIERLTGGLYHATVHRVLNNTSGHDRYSIPFFFDPTLNAQVPARIHGLDQSTSPAFLMNQAGGDDSDVEEQAAFETCSETKTPETEWDIMVHGLDALGMEDGGEEKEEEESWSNGEHIFETVHRCHPEVYARWYNREL